MSLRQSLILSSAFVATMVHNSLSVSAAPVITSPAIVLQNTLGSSPLHPIARIIDHSGLSVPFVSGVTDFDNYLAQAPLHSRFPSHEWSASGATTTGIIDFDMGRAMLIDRTAIWNEEVTGVSSLNVFTSDDPSFGTSSLVGSFAVLDTTRDLDYVADVHLLVPTAVRYVRFEVLGAYADPLNKFVTKASLGEVAFSTTTVPEQSTFVYMSTGVLFAAGCVLRRRSH
ncbi:MAG: hypothetical protein WD851_09685 [Pirellulales bacterium]